MIITNLEVYGKADADAEIETIDSFSITLRAPNGTEGEITLNAEEFIALLCAYDFLAAKHKRQHTPLARKVGSALCIHDETYH
jgi:hypothetical protein